jgi:hypothetical protein
LTTGPIRGQRDTHPSALTLLPLPTKQTRNPPFQSDLLQPKRFEMALFFLIVIRYFPAPLLCAKIPSAILVSSAIRARVVGEVEEGERSRMQKEERRKKKYQIKKSSLQLHAVFHLSSLLREHREVLQYFLTLITNAG